MRKGSWYLLLLMILAVGLTACSALELRRHPHSGYSDSEDARSSDTYYAERATVKELRLREELSLPFGRPLTETERDKLYQRTRLKNLESHLESSQARKQYYAFKPYMPDDQARAYFLSLPTLEARERWAVSQGFTAESETISPDLQDAIDANDIIIGMSQKAVLESWGDPDMKESAGDPIYGNERWQYTKMVSSGDGYNKEHRMIYFEAGRVIGWETN